jgi:hypothetical protein
LTGPACRDHDRRALAALLVMALAVGCASTTLHPGSTLNLAAPCLPPGITEEFFFWPIVAFRQVELRTEDGESVNAVWVVYSRGEQAVAVVWAGANLLAVDPSPETDDPDWIDSAFVLPDEDGFVLRTHPGAACLWRRNAGNVRV